MTYCSRVFAQGKGAATASVARSPDAGSERRPRNAPRLNEDMSCTVWNSLRDFMRRLFGLSKPALSFWLAAALGATLTAFATQEDWPAGMAELLPDRTETIAATAPDPMPVSASLPEGEDVNLALGPIAPAPGQPSGALTGRIVFTSAGHGWYWNGSTWTTQRGLNWEMVEDYGNLDQMTLFVFYCFNAGATVVPFRPVGFQTNEVVLDNDDPGVTWSGSWSDSTSTTFFGSPGDVPYRFATASATETATATYTPNIPRAGFYPVYTWALAGGNRTNQLYRIRHTGGEAQVRVPHHLVGGGWIYLGTYYFDAGSNPDKGAVVISNLAPAPGATAAIIADAIRFGNGMGSINRGSGVSGFPREEECARYWVQAGLGQGQPTSLYDDPTLNDSDDNVSTPPRTAREMNREASGNLFKRLYIGFHSNASGLGTNSTARGDVGLYNNNALFPGTATSNQFRLAEILATNVDNALKQVTVPPFEVGWTNNRNSLTYARSDFAYGEIRGDRIGYEMDATILEVAFHDNAYDSLLLRDPKFRIWVARASCQAVVRYMNQFDGVPLDFLPEPPWNVHAVASANGILISWNIPVAGFSTGTPAGYRVYISTNGYGFGNPVSVAGLNTTNVTLTHLASDKDYYFCVAATNAGGESFPSETVGCRRASNPAQSRVLFVNGFDRFERTTNLRQPDTRPYRPPGNTGTMDRVMPWANNAFDYVVPHGKAISAFGMPFDSCARPAVTNHLVALTNYQIVIWQAGQNVTNTFRALERSVLTNFQSRGGHLFVSGADIAWDLDRASGPSAADRAFLNTWLRADLGADANNNSGSYTVAPAAGSIFSGAGNAAFDDGTKGIYWVKTPDAVTPTGAGATAAFSYVGGSGGTAGIQYDGSTGGGRLVYLGFPFETITSVASRTAYMADILRFFSKRPRIESLLAGANGPATLVLSGEPGLTYFVQSSSNLLHWTAFTNVTTTNGTAGFTDEIAEGESVKFYRAVLVP